MLIKNKGANRRTAPGRHSRQFKSLTDSLPAHFGNPALDGCRCIAFVLWFKHEWGWDESVHCTRHVRVDSGCYTAQMGNFIISGTTSSYLFSARKNKKKQNKKWRLKVHALPVIHSKAFKCDSSFFCPFYKFQSIKRTERYIVGCKGCALINSKNIHTRNNKWLFERLTRNHLVLLCATWHAATHLVKRERKRAGAGGSGTRDSSTVQRPLRLVCKRSAGRVTNSSSSESGGEGAGRLE